MFGNLGFGELMIILVIVLVLFGAKRIPEISASFGKGIREFKKNVNDVERSITEPEARTPSSLPATRTRNYSPPRAPSTRRSSTETRRSTLRSSALHASAIRKDHTPRWSVSPVRMRLSHG